MTTYGKKSLLSGVILTLIYAAYLGIIYGLFYDGIGDSVLSAILSNLIAWGIAFLITMLVSNYLGYAAENYPFAYWIVATVICIPTLIINIYIANVELWYLSSHVQIALLFFSIPQVSSTRRYFLTREYDYDIYDNITYNEYVTSKLSPGFVQKFIFQFVVAVIMYATMMLFKDGTIAEGNYPYLGIIIVTVIQAGWAILNLVLAAIYTLKY